MLLNSLFLEVLSTRNMRIKIIAFDLDGTLINAYEAVAVALKRVLREYGLLEADDLTIQRNVGWGERILLSAFLPEDILDEAQKKYHKYHGEALPETVKFLPGAEELLKALKEKDYSLVIATNRPVWSTDIILDCLKVKNDFTYILSGEQVSKMKPDPEILLHILEKYELSKDEMLYVGDMTVDAITGNAAGVKTVVVTTGSSTREEIEEEKPFKVIDNVYETLDILEEMKMQQAKS